MYRTAIRSLNGALSIARHLSLKEAKPSNLVFSPLSLNVGVSQIGAGASGPSLKQVLSFLQCDSIDQVKKRSSDLISVVSTDSSPGGGPKLSFANGVWIQEGLPLKHSFKQVLDNVYKASSFRVDFLNKANEIACQVNSWAKKETDGLISNILPPGSIDSETRLILANALYFKGAWTEMFSVSKTKKKKFHLLDGDSVKAPFMTRTDKQFIRKFDGFKVLRLPYRQGRDKRQFSMHILLPDSKDGLFALSEKLGSDPGFLDRHKGRKVPVDLIQLPKFKISFGFSASDTLKQLGVTSPFVMGGLSEIVNLDHVSEIDQYEELYVSEIYHKSFIEVNEEGTEAVAVFATGGRRLCAMPQPMEEFVADHPFIFLIQEDMSGEVLFFGHVVNPLEG